MQQAAACAAALMLTLFLPWYSARVLTGDGSPSTRTAWGEFSFVEAAVLLVAAGVLYLVWARSQRKAFHLPGGDGTVIMVAGAWAALLIIWRLFDTPEADTIEYGLQWGIFIALAAAVALSLAGARVRAAHRPEPPNPAAEEEDWERPPREPRGARAGRGRRPSPTAVTEVLATRPAGRATCPSRPAAPARRAAGRGLRAAADRRRAARGRRRREASRPPDRLF